MSGYHGYSKSNNAKAAEEEDRFPASVLAKKLKVSTAAIKAVLKPSEWHHTSKMFNITDYYDATYLLEVAVNGKPNEADDDEYLEAWAQLTKLRDWKAPKKDTKVYEGCSVKWLEWGGTRSHPKATEQMASDCTVEWKGGAFCVVTFPDGSTMRKKTDSRGFEVRKQRGSLIWF